MTSTENGIIFGNIVYDCGAASSGDRNVVVLNDIHVDIMDYIVPASCNEQEFRQMWAEFEWENKVKLLIKQDFPNVNNESIEIILKVAVNTTITDLSEYLKSLLAATNMRSLTPDKAMQVWNGFSECR